MGTQAESQIFSYLPKVTGRRRPLLVDLRHRARRRRPRPHPAQLLVRGAPLPAAPTGSAPCPADAVPQLLRLLHDRTFLVRRVALRALGAIGDPAAVVPILRTSGGRRRPADP